MSTVAVASRKLLMSRVEDAFSLYSDLYKDVHGFRPRGGMTYADISVDPKGSLLKIEGSIAILEEDLREILNAERREREAFVAKVAALGLEPAKYMRLFSDYCDE